MNWYDLINPERTEIVFSTRNKAYGGYVIRNHYEKNLLIALFIALGTVSSAIFLPLVLRNAPVFNIPVISDNYTPIEPIDPSIFNPPPPPVDPPTIKPPSNPNPRTDVFTVPLVGPDSVIDLPPTQGQFDSTLLASAIGNPDGTGAVDVPDGSGMAVDYTEPLLVVDEPPSFPGGEKALLKYLASNINYLKKDKEDGIQGRVFINFTVDKNGKVKDVKLLRGIGGSCDSEAMRVVINMPKWRPGRQQGNPVAVYYVLPVNFVLK